MMGGNETRKRRGDREPDQERREKGHGERRGDSGRAEWKKPEKKEREKAIKR